MSEEKFEIGEKVWWMMGQFVVLGIFRNENEDGTSNVRTYQKQHVKYSDQLTPKTEMLHSQEKEKIPNEVSSML